MNCVNSSGTPADPGNPERGYARSGFHQQGVGVAVVAAFKLHDVLALGIGAGQADGRHGRFGARAHEAHFLHVRERGNHQFGQIGFGGRGRSEAGAAARRRNHGFDHGRGGMAENERSPGADVIHVFVAIGIPDVGTLAAHDVQRIASHGTESAYRGVDASGNQLFGAFLQLAGLLGFAGHGPSR